MKPQSAINFVFAGAIGFAVTLCVSHSLERDTKQPTDISGDPQKRSSAFESPSWFRMRNMRGRTFTNQFSGECYVVLMMDNDFSTLQIDRLTTNSNGYTISSNTLLPTIK